MTDFTPVRDAYAAWAPQYDTDTNRTRDLDALLLRRAALPLDGATVVEFGAGTGKNTAYLASRAASVVALDFSDAMLAVARARSPGPHVTFALHDVTHPWPVADGVADLAVGNLVLEHVAALGPVFEQARRVLRPGGLLYVAELHPYRQWRGSGARFEGPSGAVRIKVVTHSVSDYVMTALRAGFHLVGIDEAYDEPASDDAHGALPRLLQMTFVVPI